MAARSIGSARLVIRSVVVPVKLFTATSAKKVSFCMLHHCGSRLKQVLRCDVEKIDIERADVVKAYEHTPDRYVRFTDEEVKALEAELEPDTIAIGEFVPESAIHPVYAAGAVTLAPDKGAAAAFVVLHRALARRGLAAVGRWGKELVVVRQFGDALTVHSCFREDEVRGTSDIEQLGKLPPPNREALRYADELVADMTRDAFDASRYPDRWAPLVARAVEEKIAGKGEITPPKPRENDVGGDLIEALKASIAARPGPRKVAGGRARKSA